MIISSIRSLRAIITVCRRCLPASAAPTALMMRIPPSRAAASNSRVKRSGLRRRWRRLNDRLAGIKTPELAALDRKIESLKQATHPLAALSPSNGYHSAISPSREVTKWVQVDLGREVPIDRVRLWPARPTDFPDTPGFGFPLRFKIEASNDVAFGRATVLMDSLAADYANPGNAPVDLSGKGVTATICSRHRHPALETTG